MNDIKIFLSHASEDKELVLKIYHSLKKEGFKPWLDKEDLLIGQEWNLVIPKEIRESDYVMVFLSKHSVSKRGYVQKEFKLVLDVLDTIPEGKVFVIPVKIDDCEIPDAFAKFHWINLSEEGALEKIIKSLKKHSSILSKKPSALEAASNSLEDLIANANTSVNSLKNTVLQVSENVLKEYSQFLQKERAGVSKLLQRQKYEKVIGIPNGGSWYSFTNRSHELWNESEISLRFIIDSNEDRHPELSLSFMGISYGFFLPVTELDINSDITPQFPPTINDSEKAPWEYLWNYAPPESMIEARLEQRKFSWKGVPVGNMILKSSTVVYKGNLFLARIINYKCSNNIVLIKVAEVESDSITICFQILQEFKPQEYVGREPSGEELEEMYNVWEGTIKSYNQ